MRSVLTAFCLFASTAHAVPAQFTHQGRLLDSDGAPLGDEATIMFRVTDSEVGGTALWEETITTSLTNGFYSAVLGASEDNPLDTDVLSQAPVWLELQLDGEPAMFPRSPINAVPYATMATVAEEVSGGPVDASQIAVDGTPVVNELGEWVGPAPTVNWTDIEGMPEDFADGIDDDTVIDSDSLAALGTSCLDGDIPVWDSVLVEWVCGIDAVLTADEVDAIVADNGYAMESEVFSSTFLDLTDVPDGLDDGDDNTQLSESEVDGMVADNGYAMAADAFSRLFSDLIGIPEDLTDGDDNTQLSEDEVDGYVADDIAALESAVDSDVAALLVEIETLREQVAALESAGAAAGSVMYGDYSINNSVDLVGMSGFTEITGDLTIAAGGLPNVDALESLELVGGSLIVRDNTGLTHLDGLTNVTSVGKDLTIEDNETLINLDGLSNITSIGWSLHIKYNDALIDISGLNGIGTIASYLTIQNNNSLEEITGLNSIERLDGQFTVNNNTSLTSITGFASLSETHGMYINDNNALTEITGFGSIDAINGYLQVYDNDRLMNINGLNTLSFVQNNAYINENDDLCMSVIEELIVLIGSRRGIGGITITTGNDTSC
jgi:hypothetical protein